MLLRDYFANTAAEWDAVYRRPTLYASFYRRRLEAALACVDALAPVWGRAALDVGCGPGLGSLALARRGFRVHAVDATAKMVARTVSRARAVQLPVVGSVADLRRLPLADSTIDLAFVVGVSEWLAQLDGALRELGRVLAPGGALVLTADNSLALSCLVDPLQHPLVVPWKRALGVALRRLRPERRPLRTFARSRRTLVTAMRRAGFELILAQTLGFGPFTFFNRAVIPDSLGHALDRRLQSISWLRGAGLTHILVAAKVATS
jgi:SAM-dependent methyltransferase